VSEELDRLEFYKELYYKELESKEILSSRFNTNVTLVTFIFAGLFFCIKNINDIKDDAWSFYPFLVLAAISIIMNVIIIVLLCQYLAGRNYEFIISAKELNDRHEFLKGYYEPYPHLMEKAESQFKEEIINYYISAAHYNFHVNDARIKKMGRVQECIIVSIIATLLSISCYIPTFLKEDANVQKVEMFKPSQEKKQQVEEKSTDSQEKVSEKKVVDFKKKNELSKEENDDK